MRTRRVSFLYGEEDEGDFGDMSLGDWRIVCDVQGGMYIGKEHKVLEVGCDTRASTETLLLLRIMMPTH
jgi:hypothetical protein